MMSLQRHACSFVFTLLVFTEPIPTHGVCNADRGACAAIPTFADGLTPVGQLHVSNTGSNITGDGSLDQPFATIAFAATKAVPGTAIVVHPGVHAGGTFLNNLAGTIDAPIWIGGISGQPRPIIEGGGQGLHLVRARYVIIHDLEVRNATANGINADDGGETANPLASHHLIFRNLAIHDIGGTGNQDGLKLSGINDFVILDCDIARTGGGNAGSGIDMVGCHRGLIARCTFNDGSGSGVQAKGGSEDVEVRWCTFVNAGLRSVNIGGSTGFAFFRPPLSETTPNFEARNIRVLGNVFVGSDSPIAFVGSVHCIVAQNTIVNPTRWLLRILQETTSSPPHVFLPCGDSIFESNLLFFSRALLSTHINVGGNTAPATFSFARNLWYAHDNPAQSTPALPSPELQGVYGVNPMLVAPMKGDLRLQSASPAAHAGGPQHVPGDHDLLCWCEPPAIGAYEWPRSIGDVNCDGTVNVADLLAVISAWGPCIPPGGPCASDVNGDGVVNVTDLLAVIAHWG